MQKTANSEPQKENPRFGFHGKSSRLGQIWVKQGFGDGFDPNCRWIYLGQFGTLLNKNSRFRNFYAAKTAVFSGRSIGIRTRGLLDPKSPQGENPILFSPYRRIVSIILGFVNYLVQLIHTVLTYSGSRFGSGNVTISPKSEFSELLKSLCTDRIQHQYSIDPGNYKQ